MISAATDAQGTAAQTKAPLIGVGIGSVSSYLRVTFKFLMWSF